MGRNDQELFDKIQSCGEELKFPSPDFDYVSNEAKDFIRGLLVKDEANRPTACELLDHPWMTKAAQWKDEIDAAASENNSKSSVFKKLFRRFGKKWSSTTLPKTKASSEKAGSNVDPDGITHKSSGELVIHWFIRFW